VKTSNTAVYIIYYIGTTGAGRLHTPRRHPRDLLRRSTVQCAAAVASHVRPITARTPAAAQIIIVSKLVRIKWEVAG